MVDVKDQAILVTAAATWLASNPCRMRRDFTYIDDVTRVVSKLIDLGPADNPAAADAPSRTYHVGNHRPEKMHVVGLLERELVRTAIRIAANAAGKCGGKGR